jgi:hypothetical protein
LFKSSLSEVVTAENRASSQIVWVARHHYQEALQIFKKIYRLSKKNGFSLDRKLNAIPDLCSPCFTDHSSEEVIPVFEELRKSQKDNTKELHLMKLEGAIAELHTPLSPNHPNLTLNRFLMSLLSTRDPLSKIFTSMDTPQQPGHHLPHIPKMPHRGSESHQSKDGNPHDGQRGPHWVGRVV